MGSAPAAKLLAIRAFGVASNGAESNSFVILKALDYAASHGAQIVNMSFAGPKDDLIGRAIVAVAAKGIVMVAAAGNAGAKSPPLYPAANAHVIAVSATDAQDRLFEAFNRGDYIAASCKKAGQSACEKVKKTCGSLERLSAVPRHNGVGAANPPQRGCIRRERPSTLAPI